LPISAVGTAPESISLVTAVGSGLCCKPLRPEKRASLKLYNGIVRHAQGGSRAPPATRDPATYTIGCRLHLLLRVTLLSGIVRRPRWPEKHKPLEKLLFIAWSWTSISARMA